jgi:hypothetical protein
MKAKAFIIKFYYYQQHHHLLSTAYKEVMSIVFAMANLRRKKYVLILSDFMDSVLVVNTPNVMPANKLDGMKG